MHPLKPISSRFLLILSALMLGGFSAVSVINDLRAGWLIDREIKTRTLPLTSAAVVSSLQLELLQPILASGLMADNTFLIATLRKGNQDERSINRYLQSIQKKTGAITTFLVADRNQLYHHPTGVIKTVSEADQQDRWYHRFRTSKKKMEINIDRDTADRSRTTAFINVRLEDEQGHFLGATGLGLELNKLKQQLTQFQQQYGARILLVHEDGHIVLSSDGSSGRLEQLSGLSELTPEHLRQPNATYHLNNNGQNLYIRTTAIPEIRWTLVVIQARSTGQKTLAHLLIHNLIASWLVGGFLIVVAQMTLGNDQRRIETLAHTDTLSGLYNRTNFESLFHHLSAQLKRSNELMTMALIDIDHFKQVNDHYGHLIGDEAIRYVSSRLAQQRRESDPLFRWGGEEFLLLMPNTDLEAARLRLEAIRLDLSHNPLQLNDTQESIRITLSFGLTLYQPGESSADLLKRADQALYDAKRQGRDRICIQTEPISNRRRIPDQNQHSSAPP